MWAPSTQDGDWLQVDEQLEREFDGEDALIYVWEGPEAGDVVEVGRTLDYPGSLDTQRNLTYSSDFVGDPATKLSEAALATKRATWDELPEPDSRGSLAAGGVVIGILLAVGAIAVIWVVMFGVRVCSGGRLRIPGQWTWTEGADRG
ncbi:MAG: hypothetical protein L0H93_01860 [Nocardioides sp.]|nr:hypothetical protein [Nocardioides sp.]